MSVPAILPAGRLDQIKAGERSITVQTEFFVAPSWRIEIKVYVGGALKKFEKFDLAAVPEAELQGVVDEKHQTTTAALLAKLKAKST